MLKPNNDLRLAAFQERSRVNGPGERSVVWVQGCSRECPGCFNPDFQDDVPAETISASDLTDRLLAISDTDGVTFSGGEPFEQPGPLADVGEALHAAGRSLVIFTGYTEDELAASDDPDVQRLLAVADLLVAGPYIETRASSEHPLLSSANQELVFLTERYRDYDFGVPRKQTEFRIKPDGTTDVSGFPRQ